MPFTITEFQKQKRTLKRLLNKVLTKKKHENQKKVIFSFL